MKPQALNLGLTHMITDDWEKGISALQDGKEVAMTISTSLAGFLANGDLESLETAENMLEHLQAALTRTRRYMYRKEDYNAGHTDGHREGRLMLEEVTAHKDQNPSPFGYEPQLTAIAGGGASHDYRR